jgi:hypothetical protein
MAKNWMIHAADLKVRGAARREACKYSFVDSQGDFFHTVGVGGTPSLTNTMWYECVNCPLFEERHPSAHVESQR